MAFLKRLTLFILLPVMMLFASCKDDNDDLQPNTNIPITGYWQLGQDYPNSDGTAMGIIVHGDGKISEWQYSASNSDDPFQLGYKTGTWTINGDHFDLQLNNGTGGYYTATVASNDTKEMRLAYNGKLSAIPFYNIDDLPGNGGKILQTLSSMKFDNLQISDLTGYWVKQDPYTSEDDAPGIYIDDNGNISNISNVYSVNGATKTIDYHTGSITSNNGVLSFDYFGEHYQVYAVGEYTLLATTNDIETGKVYQFDRLETPEIVAEADNYFNETVDSRLLGTWESVHYVYLIGNDTITNVDITPSDSWAMQMYRKYAFSSNHKVSSYYTYGSDYHGDSYFRYSDATHTLTTSDDLNGILIPDYTYKSTSTVRFNSATEMVMTSPDGDATKIYTYRKQ